MFTLKKSDYGDALKNCVVGKPDTLTITANPIAVTDAVVVYDDPTEVEYSEGAAEEPAAEAPVKETPYRPKARKGSAMAADYAS